MAARLAEDADLQVALVEAGPTDAGDERVADLRRWPELLGSELDFDYAIESQPRGNSRIRHSRGRLLGGCSSHNSCIAFRAPDSDLRKWEELGATGWGPEGTVRAFERVYDTVHIAPAASQNSLNAAFLKACAEAGIPAADFAVPGMRVGCGVFSLNARGAQRQSSSVAYLHSLPRRPDNLTVLTDRSVHAILLDDNGLATGVGTARGALTCRNEVVVSCGAFDSPKLLQLSGIGPRDLLNSLGIPVRLDLSGVGEHLLDHPEGVVLFESRLPIPTQTSQFWEYPMPNAS